VNPQTAFWEQWKFDAQLTMQLRVSTTNGDNSQVNSNQNKKDSAMQAKRKFKLS
jgi:hypothetical protein